MPLGFKLPAVTDDGNPQLNGSVAAGDTTIALKSGHGARLPTIYTGAASSTGDARTLNDTGDLGSVATGDFIENTTDGSWAVVITAGTNQVRTTPLRGGSDNTWTSGDTWAVNRFYCRLTKYDADGNITQKEKVLVNSRVTDTITVTRGQDGDSAASFVADDYCNLMVLKVYVDEAQKALREALSEIDDLYRGGGSYAAASGSAPTYVITLSPTVTALSDVVGKPILFKANFDNTGACNLNVNGLGATAIKKTVSTDPLANDILTNQVVCVAYDGTNFQIVSNIPASTAVALTVSNKTADYAVSASNDLGKVITNAGASSHVVLSLPGAVAGLYYTFAVAAAQTLRVQPASGDTIENATAQLLGLVSQSTHSLVELVCIDTAKWLVRSITGTWLSIPKGWWVGGEATGPASVDLIAGFRFDTEAHANISATLNAARRGPAGVSSLTNGYIAGGFVAAVAATITRLKFVDETDSDLAATLDVARRRMAAFASSSKGYFAGGDTGSDSDDIDDIDFAAETSALLGTALPAAKTLPTGGHSSTKGYVFGGTTGTAIYAFTFSGETIATLGTTLATNREGMGAVNSSAKTYLAGGDNGSAAAATIYAFVHSGETISTLAATLDQARSRSTGIHSSTKGYFGGGQTHDGGTYYDKIDDMSFSGETSAVLVAVLSANRSQTAGCQNSLS